jgi:prephenate dehydrogenase
MLFDTLSIVGVGLLGGSVGLAAKGRRLVGRVVGVGRDPEKLAAARAAGVIDDTATLADAARRSDLMVFCTPVDRIAGEVVEAAAVCRPGTLLTDVGSTKGAIVAAVAGRLPAGVHFVPSHPMAGSEKKGAAHARADLFDGRVTVVTPSADTDPAAAERVAAFWKALGSRVVTLPPAEHDTAVAYISHLPHAVSAALAAVADPSYLPLAAGGFRDTTRIAAAAPGIWEPIFRTNRDAVLESADRFAARFDEFRRLLRADDGPGLVRWLSEGKRVRDALGS